MKEKKVQEDSKIVELTNDLQRTRADFENFRKQVENQKEKGKIPHNGSFTDYSIQKQKELAALPVSFFSNAG